MILFWGIFFLCHLILLGKNRQTGVTGASVWPKALAEAIFKPPKNHKDGSNFDENLIESIAAMRSTSPKNFPRHPGSKNTISKSFPRPGSKIFRENLFFLLCTPRCTSATKPASACGMQWVSAAMELFVGLLMDRQTHKLAY